eukprot:3987978-Amphidinium_carterae.3
MSKLLSNDCTKTIQISAERCSSLGFLRFTRVSFPAIQLQRQDSMKALTQLLLTIDNNGCGVLSHESTFGVLCVLAKSYNTQGQLEF